MGYIDTRGCYLLYNTWNCAKKKKMVRKIKSRRRIRPVQVTTILVSERVFEKLLEIWRDLLSFNHRWHQIVFVIFLLKFSATLSQTVVRFVPIPPPNSNLLNISQVPLKPISVFHWLWVQPSPSWHFHFLSSWAGIWYLTISFSPFSVPSLGQLEQFSVDSFSLTAMIKKIFYCYCCNYYSGHGGW